MDRNERAVINPRAIPIEEAAHLLRRHGWTVTADMIRADVEAGAPLNPDGTLDLLRYAAWLVSQHD